MKTPRHTKHSMISISDANKNDIWSKPFRSVTGRSAMAIDDKTVDMNNEFGERIELKGRQVECVNYSGASSLLIKGTAGSGKTLILAKIAKNLLADNPPIDGKPQVCIFVYTTSLHDAMIELLEANNINVSRFPGEVGEIGVFSIKKYIFDICNTTETVPRGFRALKDKDRLGLIAEVLESLRKYPYHHHSYDLDAEFWEDELKWMYSNGVADESDREKYLSMDRKGRCKKYKTRMTDSGRRAAFDFLIRYNDLLYKNNLYEWDRVHALLLKKLESRLIEFIPKTDSSSGPSIEGIDDDTRRMLDDVRRVYDKLDPENPKKWGKITDEEIVMINHLAVRMKHELNNSPCKATYDFSSYTKSYPLLPPSINNLWAGEIAVFTSKYNVQEIRDKIGSMQHVLMLFPGLVSNNQKNMQRKISALKSLGLEDYVHAHFLIDECQDVSLTDMRIFVCMNISPKMHIAMDRNQSLYGHQWSFRKDAGIATSVKKLDMTFRSTRQIDEFANDLKRIDDQSLDDEDRYDNLVSDIQGGLPRIVSCRDKADENDYILDIIDAFSGQNVTTAIIVPTRSMFDTYYDFIHRMRPKEPICKIGEPGATVMKPGIKISTIHKAKGLGFTNVIVPSFNRGAYPKSEESIINSIKKRRSTDALSVDNIQEALNEEISDYRKLAYVAVTRAKMNLIITYTNPSPFIAEFDKAHYELLNTSNKYVEDTRISNVTSVESEDDARLKKALDRSSIKQRYTPGGESKPADYRNMSVIEAIVRVGLGDRLVDNRDNRGKLYIIGGTEISSSIDELKKMGFKFKPTIPIRATDNKKAWVYEGRSGYVV